MTPIRVRIAPSPSGFLHIGTAKVALFNWLLARQQGGTFILRLEDTDAERSSEEFATAMCEGFHWLGIDWDEGPEFGDVPAKGDHGPYRQSQRKALHVREANRLLAEGKAYKCFATTDEMDALRAEHKLIKNEGKWRDVSAEDVAAMGDAPFVIRFKVPEGETVIRDLVQGEVRTNNREIDDFVIVKANGDPLFHLAVVVDDGLMGVTHVIRGDDHLTNCTRHVMLFNALGYPLPQFAHLPMVLDEQGKKFSKRLHGANVLDWRDDGYLPETIINYVALLGWTPAEENRELFARDELVQAFDMKRLGGSAAKFDRKKLDWLNGQHIRRLSPEALRDLLVPVLERAGFDLSGKSPEWLAQLALVCQEKLPTLNDIVRLADFFFIEPSEYEEKAVRKQWSGPEAGERLVEIKSLVSSCEPFTHDTLKAAFEARAQEAESSLGPYVHPARLAFTGKSVGPGLFELAELLGREACLHRLDRAAAFVATLAPAAG
jgi:glutamyl-tRNA synthetase